MPSGFIGFRPSKELLARLQEDAAQMGWSAAQQAKYELEVRNGILQPITKAPVLPPLMRALQMGESSSPSPKRPKTGIRGTSGPRPMPTRR